MKPSVAFEQHKRSIRGLLARSPKVANPRVFGSALHGTDREGSDLDLLVDALPGTSLWDLCGLQHELEALLGVPVDLLTPQDLIPRFRSEVLFQAQPV